MSLIFLMLLGVVALHFFPYGKVQGTTFTFVNKCHNIVWVGIQGNMVLSNGGFELAQGRSISLNAPNGWQGRFWGRTLCAFDHVGRGVCATGDCGGVLECKGIGGQPPATLAEFTVGHPKDFYDVSLVDGYNLEISITPRGGSGACQTAGCSSDLNQVCPSKLQMDNGGEVVACKSACDAFNKPEYCCTGAYSSPQTCHSNTFSKIFKRACPKAYSYAYDDPSSIFTCPTGADYTISFCH
eukprot:c43040_g1_i1 orf=468-1187(+)